MQPAIWSRWPLRRRPLCALHQPSHRMHGCTTVATPTVLGGVAVEVTADYSRRVARGDSGRESWRGARATRGGGRESVVGWVATALRLLSGMRLKTLIHKRRISFGSRFALSEVALAHWHSPSTNESSGVGWRGPISRNLNLSRRKSGNTITGQNLADLAATLHLSQVQPRSCVQENARVLMCPLFQSTRRFGWLRSARSDAATRTPLPAARS